MVGNPEPKWANMNRFRTVAAMSAIAVVLTGCSAEDSTDKAGESTSPASALNGTYRRTLTADDQRSWDAAHGLPPAPASEFEQFPNTYTTTLKDGVLTGSESSFPGEGHGTYTLDGDLITFSWPNGDGPPSATYSFSVDTDGTCTSPHDRATPIPTSSSPLSLGRRSTDAFAGQCRRLPSAQPSPAR